MCHCFDDVSDLTERERREILDSHSTEELRAELSDEELDALDVAA